MQVTDLRLTRRANLRALLGGSAAATALTLAPHLPRTAGAAHTPLHVPIAGAATAPVAGAFAGGFTVERFLARQGTLYAAGTLTGAITPTAGGAAVPIASTQIQLPVDLDAAATDATCDILTLVLGPLHVDLLGLVVDLNQVELTITAQQGPGNLLGNLLCAIAGLLDGNGPLQGLAQLLNQLLRLLG